MAAEQASPIRRLAILVGGQGAAAALGFVNVALAAHHLPAVVFGFLVTGQALALGLRLALGTQSWQAVVRHGGRHPLRLAASLAAIDHAFGCLAAVLYLAVLHLGGSAMGLDPAAIAALSWLALGMALQAAEPWVGVLLAADRQGLVASVLSGAALLRCAGIVLAALSGCGLGGFVAAHLAADIANTVLALALALAAQRPRLIAAVLLRPLSPARLAERYPGLPRLLGVGLGGAALIGIGTNLDVPLAAIAMGPEDAGRYRLIRSFVGLALVVAIPLRQLALTRWSSAPERDLRPALARVALATFAAAAAAMLAFLPCADRLLHLAFGARGDGLAQPTCVMLIAAALVVLAAPGQAALVARRHEGWSLAAQAVAFALHASLLPLLAVSGGLHLAAWSLPCAQATLFAMVGTAAWRYAGGRHA